MDVEEARFADARPCCDGVLHADTEMLGHLPTDSLEVTFALRGREDRRHDARPGRHRLGGVAVRHDEAHIWIRRHDRFQVEVVVRRLEQPQIRRAPRLQELHDPPVVVVGRRQVGGAPPGVVPVYRERELLPVERHPEHLGVLHRRIEVVEVHRLELGRDLLVLLRRLQPSRIGGLALQGRRRAGLGLLPPTQTAELRIERHHVGQGRGAGARQTIDVDRPLQRQLRDLGMLAIPRLDLEAVDEAPPEVADDVGVGRRAQIGVAREALEQHVETLAEVSRTEIRETGRLHRLGHQRITARISTLLRTGLGCGHQVHRTRSG
jgi:hypothetical protein